MRRVVASFVLLVGFVGFAQAQSHHDHHHASYQSWVNSNGQGCCNSRDCNAISESDEREIAGRLHIYIRGVGKAKGQAEWCPILSLHYLRAGNVPDATTAHVCISDHYEAETPCGQFICYQPRPLS